jgi:hypothetical protein
MSDLVLLPSLPEIAKEWVWLFGESNNDRTYMMFTLEFAMPQSMIQDI